MCASCLTNADAVVWNSVAMVGLGAAGVRRLRDVATGRSALDRRREAYARNAAFVRSLDLDPAEVLGPPPADAVPAPASRAPATPAHEPGTTPRR